MSDQGNFTKIVRLGTTKVYKGTASVYCKIEFEDGELSITGVVGPKPNGDCTGPFGQIVMEDFGLIKYAPGWNEALVKRFRDVWNDWHLNHMFAGSPAQRQFLKEHPITDRVDYYAKACAALAEAGLNPDPDFLHDGTPYRYGHAWLREDVPADVLDFLRNLPDTDYTPAWV